MTKEITTEVTVKAFDSEDANEQTRRLKKLGYKRIQNAFWIEHWVKGTHMVILERDY